MGFNWEFEFLNANLRHLNVFKRVKFDLKRLNWSFFLYFLPIFKIKLVEKVQERAKMGILREFEFDLANFYCY